VADADTKAARQLKLANAYLDFGRKDKAKSILEKIISDYPNSTAATAATKKLKDLAGNN